MTAIAITGATGFLGGALARRLLDAGQAVIAMGRDEAKLAALGQLGATCIASDLSRGAPPAPEMGRIRRGALRGPVLCLGALRSLPRGQRPRYGFGAGVRAHRGRPALRAYLHTQRLLPFPRSTPRARGHGAAAARQRLCRDQARSRKSCAGANRPRLSHPAPARPVRPGRTRRCCPDCCAPPGPDRCRWCGMDRPRTDLTLIDDVVDAVLAALGAPSGLPTSVFNISGGEPKSIRSIAEAACAQAGVAVRWRTMPVRVLLLAARAMEVANHMQSERPEPRITAYGAGLFAFTQTLDISAAKAHLGWRPAVSFEEGLRRTFEAPA